MTSNLATVRHDLLDESFCEIGNQIKTIWYLPVQCNIWSNIFGCFLGTALSLRKYAFENQLVVIELRHDGPECTKAQSKECTKAQPNAKFFPTHLMRVVCQNNQVCCVGF